MTSEREIASKCTRQECQIDNKSGLRIASVPGFFNINVGQVLIFVRATAD